MKRVSYWWDYDDHKNEIVIFTNQKGVPLGRIKSIPFPVKYEHRRLVIESANKFIEDLEAKQ